MFDVPLHDSRNSNIIDQAYDALMSETHYVKVASEASEPRRGSMYNNVKVGNLTEDANYSFDVEL